MLLGGMRHSFTERTAKLHQQVLPSDDRERQCFDIPVCFELGDPNVHFHFSVAKTYETLEEIGRLDWFALFYWILDHCFGLQNITTVFVLVDNRTLTSEITTDESLTHWPAVAAWWKSRVVITESANELCDLIFVPICKKSNLHRLHAVWQEHLSLQP